MRLILALTACLILSGCALPGGLHRATEAATLQALQEAIPLGTDAKTAQQTLERDGYECRSYSQGLRCTKQALLPGRPFDTVWNVNLRLQQGRVAAITNGQGMKGL